MLEDKDLLKLWLSIEHNLFEIISCSEQSKIDDIFAEILSKMEQIIAFDRAYIITVSLDNKIKLLYEYLVKKGNSRVSYYQDSSLEDFSWLFEKLSQNEEIYLSNRTNSIYPPNDSYELFFLVENNIETIAIFKLKSASSLNGYIAFEGINLEHFSEHDFSIIRLFSNILNNLFEFRHKVSQHHIKEESIYLSLAPTIITDENQKIVYWNKAFEDKWKFNNRSVMGKKIDELFLSKDVTAILSIILNQTEELNGEIKAIDSEGYVFNTYYSAHSIKSSLKKRFQIFSFVDIQILNDLTYAVEKLERNYQSIVENQTEFITRFLVDGTYTYVNDALPSFLGLKKEDIIGKKITDKRLRSLIHKDDVPTLEEYYSSFKADAPITKIQYRFILPNEGIKWVDWTDRAIFDTMGNITEIQAVGRDITKEKDYENMIKESEIKYKALFDSDPNIIFTLDLGGIVTSANTSFLEFTKLSKDELVGQNLFQLNFFPKQDILKYKSILESIIQKDNLQYFESRIRDNNGREFYFEVRANKIIKDNLPLIIQFIAKDVTENRQNRLLFKESETKYKQIFNFMSNPILFHDLDGQIIEMNEKASLFFDNGDKVRPTNIFDLFESVWEEYLRHKLSCITEKEEVKFKTMLLIKGEYAPFQFKCKKIELKDNYYIVTTIENIKEETHRLNYLFNRFKLEEANIYLVDSFLNTNAIEAFKDLIDLGYNGIAISEMDNVPKNASIYNKNYFNNDNKINYNLLINIIELSELKEVIYIDFLEYLIEKDNKSILLDFLEYIKKIANWKKTIFIISIDSNVVDDIYISILKKYSNSIEMKATLLPKELSDVLRYVYHHNLKGTRPKFSQIGDEFSLTRPTIKKRLGILMEKGYIIIHSNGRSKYVELTEEGGRLFNE